MNIDFEKENVGDIVRKDYRAARVFKAHHIDFCCGGGKTLSQVCAERKLSEADVQAELEAELESQENQTPAFDTWPLDLLVDYIEKKHHRYVESTLPLLRQYLQKLAAVHGQDAPYLHEMAEVFNISAGNLAQHMKKEELVLFPYIRKMYKAQLTGENIDTPHFRTVQNPIASMMNEHDNEGEHFRQLETLSSGYDIPNWACNTFAVGMQLLKEFQDDLHMHIHLENNILFPKAVELEQAIAKSTSEEDAQPFACSL